MFEDLSDEIGSGTASKDLSEGQSHIEIALPALTGAVLAIAFSLQYNSAIEETIQQLVSVVAGKWGRKIQSIQYLKLSPS